MCSKSAVPQGVTSFPFAAAHPQAHVVGIDLSQVQVDQGRARAQALGLDNLELLASDIARMDLDALGQFDFVIAHGVYSWVPPEVQEALLSALPQVVGPRGRGLHELQRVSGLEGQGNRSRCDAAGQRRQRDAGREGARGAPHGRLP